MYGAITLFALLCLPLEIYRLWAGVELNFLDRSCFTFAMFLMAMRWLGDLLKEWKLIDVESPA